MTAHTRVCFDFDLGGVGIDVTATFAAHRRGCEPDLLAIDCSLAGSVFDPEGLYVKSAKSMRPLIGILEERAIDHLFAYPVEC